MATDAQSQPRRDDIPDSGGVSVNGQETIYGSCGRGSFGVLTKKMSSPRIVLRLPFLRAIEQRKKKKNWDTSISMVHLGWLNVELKSNDWVKVMDQPPVRIMKITMDEEKDRKKTKNFVNEDDGTGTSVKTYCVSDVEMSKQQELVEASYQLRSRILEFNAVSFVAIPLELVPLEVDYVDALSKQDVPDYFAGPSMAVTQETRVVFGFWTRKGGVESGNIGPNCNPLPKLDVYEAVSRVDVGHQEILPGRLVLVVKPNPEGVKGKKKARIVVCGEFPDYSPGRDDVFKDSFLSYASNAFVLSFISGLADRNMGCINSFPVRQVVWG